MLTDFAANMDGGRESVLTRRNRDSGYDRHYMIDKRRDQAMFEHEKDRPEQPDVYEAKLGSQLRPRLPRHHHSFVRLYSSTLLVHLFVTAHMQSAVPSGFFG